MELEMFVHGALCMCVSGQCYLSAMLGGRSGNRGLCAQPCRLGFSADASRSCDLSLKDLSLIGNINEIAQAGVVSLKIEGRMKRPEYVAAAVTSCKKAIDGEYSASDENTLKSVFSRTGFTDGYFTGERKDMFGTRQKRMLWRQRMCSRNCRTSTITKIRLCRLTLNSSARRTAKQN